MNKKIELLNPMVPVALLRRHKIRMEEDSVRFRESWLPKLSGASQAYAPGS